MKMYVYDFFQKYKDFYIIDSDIFSHSEMIDRGTPGRFFAKLSKAQAPALMSFSLILRFSQPTDHPPDQESLA